MSHWTLKYLGQPWTPERNCYYWFRQIMIEQFGRDGLPPNIVVDEKSSARLAMREFANEAVKQHGWVLSKTPREGDAVFLAEGKRSSHIGVATYIKGKFLVVHARKNTGVVVSDVLALKMNNLKITGSWTYENIL